MVKSTTRKRTTLDEWDDVWLYLLVFGCLSVLVLVLVHRKLTRQKGTWSRGLRLDHLYRYSPADPITTGGGGKTTDSRGEVECRRFLETTFRVPFPKARPAFLRNPITGNNLEIDCFNPTIGLGVEYNGKQHYAFNDFFHRNKEAAMNQQYRDELKRRMCHENGVVLIEVPYTIKLSDIGPFLYARLKNLGFIAP
ncbi:hypothetical protein MIV033L [Invertebrate iridescent virus 3]|uniref:Uncharacterized protein 033L n=1 Tax=Invertebrate iridescent virus 3 TaxID=345201 RepID=VF307_IIV3|nr:hypothetical protein MIV033L [Invertebrate iridescent virus 3]Q197C7.1 RecName: Full=Uncharacterized protein 033L [Invertebrate iridescent virus 3]ABF82063.1 hypothetical protein MIV033L [Invertebrate iridescent virus 3]